MKPAEFEYLENKILSDKEFTKKLLEDPAKTLKNAGILITPEVLEAIQGVDGSTYHTLAHLSGKDQPEN